MEAAVPARRGGSFFLAVALTLFAAGFAYAMPRMQNTSADGETDGQVVVAETPSPTPIPTETPTAVPSPTPSDDSDGDGGDNHGKVVSTAAHCDVKGKAHGELVRSIAKDKEATVADAEAACAEAMAAQAAAGTDTHGKPQHEKPVREKPDHAHPTKLPKPQKTVEPTPDTDDDESVDPGDDEEHGKPDKPSKP